MRPLPSLIMPCAVLALLALPPPTSRAAAAAPVAFPGAAWGGLSRDFNGLEGSGTIGWVRQGVTWARLPGSIDATTYGAYRWRLRSRNRPFYDEQGPAATLDLSTGPVSAGLDLNWQYYPELKRQSDEYQLYLGWYRDWDLARGKGASFLRVPLVALPLSTWGWLSHDLNGLEGDGAMGWVSQGIDWARLPRGWVLRTLASYSWRVRSKERIFYNTYGPSVGIEARGHGLEVGVENVWRSYPELQHGERVFQLYLNWYYVWDLRRR